MFRYTYAGKNFTVTDALKQRTENKLAHLQKLLAYDVDVKVNFSVDRQSHRIEVTIPLRHRILRAEESSGDMFTSLDQIEEALEKQLIKYKGRLRGRSRRGDASSTAELKGEVSPGDNSADYEDNPIVIDRRKHFALKPMDPDEAAMEMELQQHTFYVFRNAQTDLVNVVYKRKDGTYGLIEPEY
jgi:putative sigma-54 modulation protein